jgi:hypothetical protein
MANQAALIRNVVADVLMGSMKTASALFGSVFNSKNIPVMVAEFGSSNCPYWHIEGFVCPYAVFRKRSGLFFIHG